MKDIAVNSEKRLKYDIRSCWKSRISKKKMDSFKKELAGLLKRYGWEGASETPDYILADYVERCLNSYCFANRNAFHNWTKLEDDNTTKKEEKWYYLAKGELPDKDGEYLCRYYKYGLHFSGVSRYHVQDNKWYHLIYDEEYRVPKPDAWQEIILPEEEA